MAELAPAAEAGTMSFLKVIPFLPEALAASVLNPFVLAVTIFSVTMGIFLEDRLFGTRDVGMNVTYGHDVIYHWTSNPREAVHQKLVGMTMTLNGTDSASLKSDYFNDTYAYASLHISPDPLKDGLTTGLLRFQVPGFDDHVEGNFVTINQTGVHQPAKDHFYKMVELYKQKAKEDVTLGQEE